MAACAATACSAGAGPTSGTQRPGLELQSLVPLVGADRYADEIGALRARAEQIRASRKRVAQLMRNERRKRQRLIKKSQKLSNNDLLQVLQMRGQKEREAAVPAEEDGAVLAEHLPASQFVQPSAMVPVVEYVPAEHVAIAVCVDP